MRDYSLANRSQASFPRFVRRIFGAWRLRDFVEWFGYTFCVQCSGKEKVGFAVYQCQYTVGHPNACIAWDGKEFIVPPSIESSPIITADPIPAISTESKKMVWHIVDKQNPTRRTAFQECESREQAERIIGPLLTTWYEPREVIE